MRAMRIPVAAAILLLAQAAAAGAAESLFTLIVDTPSETSALPRPDVLVRGRILNTAGRETGVTVNGVGALVYGSDFAANHVPLGEGGNLLVVSAEDADGRRYRCERRLAAGPASRPVRITAAPESGILPLESTLSIEAAPGVSGLRLSVRGPGGTEELEGAGTGPVQVHISRPGLYFFTLEALSQEGRTASDTTALLAQKPDELDRLIRGKWQAANTALCAGDIEGSLAYFADDTRHAYREIFVGLRDQLPRILEGMQDIELVWAGSGLAKFRIRSHGPGEGPSAAYLYDVYFTNVEGGIWKLYRY